MNATIDPTGSYQSALREAEGWNQDQLQAWAAQLTKLAKEQEDLKQDLPELERQLSSHASDSPNLLVRLLERAPGSSVLHGLVATHVLNHLQQFAPSLPHVCAVLDCTLGFGRGPSLAELVALREAVEAVKLVSEKLKQNEPEAAIKAAQAAVVGVSDDHPVRALLTAQLRRAAPARANEQAWEVVVQIWRVSWTLAPANDDGSRDLFTGTLEAALKVPHLPTVYRLWEDAALRFRDVTNPFWAMPRQWVVATINTWCVEAAPRSLDDTRETIKQAQERLTAAEELCTKIQAQLSPEEFNQLKTKLDTIRTKIEQAEPLLLNYQHAKASDLYHTALEQLNALIERKLVWKDSYGNQELITARTTLCQEYEKKLYTSITETPQAMIKAATLREAEAVAVTLLGLCEEAKSQYLSEYRRPGYRLSIALQQAKDAVDKLQDTVTVLKAVEQFDIQSATRLKRLPQSLTGMVPEETPQADEKVEDVTYLKNLKELWVSICGLREPWSQMRDVVTARERIEHRIEDEANNAVTCLYQVLRFFLVYADNSNNLYTLYHAVGSVRMIAGLPIDNFITYQKEIKDFR